ncbi:DUF504 domain-containing protein [Candidatus Woesearchaeota archaeon]|nr:DUF504 domain-containing protein [Candidatus Woesearchaeota archaeon]
MKTEKEMLKWIRWDKSKNPKDYTVFYFDRVLDKEVEVKFEEIEEIEGRFMTIKESTIPLHRITKIRMNGKLVWERKRVKV